MTKHRNYLAGCKIFWYFFGQICRLRTYYPIYYLHLLCTRLSNLPSQILYSTSWVKLNLTRVMSSYFSREEEDSRYFCLPNISQLRSWFHLVIFQVVNNNLYISSYLMVLSVSIFEHWFKEYNKRAIHYSSFLFLPIVS